MNLFSLALAHSLLREEMYFINLWIYAWIWPRVANATQAEVSAPWGSASFIGDGDTAEDGNDLGLDTWKWREQRCCSWHLAKSRHMPVAVVDDVVTTESVSKFTLIKYPGETRKKKKKVSLWTQPKLLTQNHKQIRIIDSCFTFCFWSCSSN